MRTLLPGMALMGLTLGCGETREKEKPVGLESYLPGKRIVIELPANAKTGRAKAQNTFCIATMRTLKAATQQWALERHKPDAAKVTLDDLAPYFLTGTKNLKCPAGGKYILTTVGEDPKCSHGHSLDAEDGDELPPVNGSPRAFWQFNKDGTVQMGLLDDNGHAVDESRMGKATYKVTGPLEVTLEAEGKEEKAKLVFTKPNPAKGDALTMLVGSDSGEELSKVPILEVTPASPLKE